MGTAATFEGAGRSPLSRKDRSAMEEGVRKAGAASHAKGPECRAKLSAESVRLLPGRKVPALRKPVEVDKVREGSLRPAPRRRIDFVRKHADCHRDSDVLRGEEGECVLPV